MYTSVRINPEKAEKGRRKRWEEDIYKKCRESLTFITLVLCCIISKAVCARAIAFPQVSTTKMENEMKCHIKSICSRGCLIALAYFLPQSAQAVDIEGTFTSDSDFPVNVADPSFYTLNGEVYSGGIDSDTNLTVNGVLSSNPTQTNILTVAASSVTSGNFTYNLELPASFWVKHVFEVYSYMTFSVENFTLYLRESDTPHPNLIIYTGSNSALNVRGDFLFSDTRSASNWYQTRLTFNGRGSVNVDGNFTIDSQISKPLTNASNCVNFDVAVQTFTVGGVLSLNNSNNNNNVFRTSSASAGTFTRTLGGLQITQNGMIQLGGNASAANTTELILTNSGTSEYIGGLLTKDSDGELADNKLNVRMAASDAANGRQIMRFTATSGWTLDSNVFSDAANALNEVEVSGGRLDMGMYDGMKGGSLMIMGYNNPSEAVFSATGAAADTEIGRVEFDSMSFYRGTVVFDLAETDGDFIKVNGAMTKITGASPLVLEMNVSAYDLQAWLEASESDEWSANLMSFATDGSNVSAEDFTLKLQDGIMGKITVSELDGVSTLTANLSLVPEPAEVAAILGAFALLLVARRRRG